MADIKLIQGAVQTPTFTNSASIAQNTPMSTAAVLLSADDITAQEDEVRVDIDFAGGTAGEAVNIYIAEGNAAGEYDGDAPVDSAVVPVDSLPNLGVPVPVIVQAAGGRGSGVFRVTKSRFVVVIENAGAIAITTVGVNVTPLNYQSN